MSQPACRLATSTDGRSVVAVLAEELGRRRLRVRVAGDGMSVRARPSWPLVLTAIGMAAGGEGFTFPGVTATVVAEGPTGATVAVLVRTGAASGMSGHVVGALNATALRLARQGVAVAATPWERYTRFGRGSGASRDSGDS